MIRKRWARLAQSIKSMRLSQAREFSPRCMTVCDVNLAFSVCSIIAIFLYACTYVKVHFTLTSVRTNTVLDVEYCNS